MSLRGEKAGGKAVADRSSWPCAIMNREKSDSAAHSRGRDTSCVMVSQRNVFRGIASFRLCV